jgi:hypothetical protein
MRGREKEDGTDTKETRWIKDAPEVRLLELYARSAPGAGFGRVTAHPEVTPKRV